jgi:hypothetical protein
MVIATTFITLLSLRASLAEIICCDGPGVSCPTTDDAADGDICYIHSGNIGVTSFDSNIDSFGPLTWTLTQHNEPQRLSSEPYAARDFWLGYPSQLSLEAVTAYEGCSMILFNVSRAFQLPAGFTDFDNSTVVGENCAADILARVREEFRSTVDAGYPDFHPDFETSPCVSLYKRLYQVPLPSRCNLSAQTIYLGSSFLTVSIIPHSLQHTDTT